MLLKTSGNQSAAGWRPRLWALFGALVLVASGCTPGGVDKSEEMTQVVALETLSPWIATSAGRASLETRVYDLGGGRVLARVNFLDNGSDCIPHHFTPMKTENPAKDGFTGIQSCRGTNETLVLEYTPTDPEKPILGGTLMIKDNLTKKYGVVSNHHVLLRPDLNVYSIADDLYDSMFFIEATEPYKPIKGFQFTFDPKTRVMVPEEVTPGPNGKFNLKTEAEEFGLLRNEFGAWTPSGDWFIQGHRNVGAFTVFDGKTLEPVAAFDANTGNPLEQVDPNDLSKGFVIPEENLTTYLHGAGTTNDSKFLLIHNMTTNTTNVFDIAGSDPADWSLHKKVEWPGSDVEAEEGSGVIPYHLTFTPDGKTAWVALRGYDVYKEGTGATAVLDIPSFEIKKIIEVPGFVEPHGLAATPDNKYVIQSFAGWDNGSGGHVVYSTESLKPVFYLPTAVSAHEIVIVQASKITTGC